MYSYGPPHMAGQKQDDQLEDTFSSYARIRDVALKTCQRRWTIGRSGERGSGISVLVARYDDDDDMVNHLVFIIVRFFVLFLSFLSFCEFWYIEPLFLRFVLLSVLALLKIVIVQEFAATYNICTSVL